MSSSSPPLRPSTLQLFENAPRVSHCGYCNTDGRRSLSILARELAPLDYDALLHCGWRRSGSLLYAISNADTCCTNLAIRCAAASFVPSKGQRRAARRFAAHLAGEDDEGGGAAAGAASPAPLPAEPASHSRIAAAVAAATAALAEPFLTAAAAAALAARPLAPFRGDGEVRVLGRRPVISSCVAARLFGAVSALARTGGVASPWSSPAACAHAIAVALPAAWRACGGGGEKVLDDGAGGLVLRLMPRDGADGEGALIFAASESGWLNFAEECEAAAVHCSSKRARTAAAAPAAATADTAALAMAAAETAAAETAAAETAAAETAAAAADKVPVLPRRIFSLTSVPSHFDAEAHALYVRYQQAVHGDSLEACSEAQYTRFLCETPLLPAPFPPRVEAAAFADAGGEAPALIAACASRLAAAWREEAEAAPAPAPAPPSADDWLLAELPDLPQLGFGSHHWLFRLDGVLVAVSVVDVLPSCLSSVYVFYEPSLRKLELGKVTALAELAWVRRAVARAPRLRHWCAGLYVHGCAKMLYKREYGPCELLCPVSWRWLPLDARALALLDAGGGAAALDADACARPEVVEAEQRARLARLDAALPRVPLLLRGGRGSGGRVALLTLGDLTAPSQRTIVELLRAFGLRCTAEVFERVVVVL